MAKKKKKTVKKKTKTKAVKKTAAKKTAKKKKTTEKKSAAKKSTQKKSTKKKATVKKKTTKKKTAKTAAKKTTSKKTKKSTRKIKKSTRAASVKAHSLRSSVPMGFEHTKPLRYSPLSEKQIEHFRKLLLIKRLELIGDVNSMEIEALRSSRMDATGDLSSMPIHMADIGTDNYEQEFALGLMDSERKLLKEILDALARIDEGVYGVCEGTGQAIPVARLEANPWARYCVQYAEMVEKGLIAEGEKTFDEDDYDDDEDLELEDEGEDEDEDDDDNHYGEFPDDEEDDDEDDDDEAYFDYVEEDEDD